VFKAEHSVGNMDIFIIIIIIIIIHWRYLSQSSHSEAPRLPFVSC
jgi:hypothetical protein